MRTTELSVLEMYLSYDQWKEEHDALQERLLELCRYMRRHPDRDDPVDAEIELRSAMQRFEPFMRDWLTHLQRERDTVYPFAKSLTGGGSIGPISVLEQDGRIAERFYREYRQSLEVGERAGEVLSRMLQVLVIAAEHFRIENEVVLPATEKWMDEVAYSGA
ncbi:hemerythrin domain-containing protein [Cohnella caldifontis]|uniref:hemerythrin domain-containing protein n=1 Tax=Cohnella caldifontis TaxID=3027471 RepID=UPI0023EB8031|nr:hemerythrin domain-containing protein [Cohnella sp. YIM B05605]